MRFIKKLIEGCVTDHHRASPPAASKMPLPRRRIAPPPRAVSQEDASHGEGQLRTTAEEESIRIRDLRMNEVMERVRAKSERDRLFCKENDYNAVVGKLHVMEETVANLRKRFAQISELASIEATAPPAPAKPMCVICEETAPEAAFIPCGHRVTCKTCGEACGTRCPICRETITGTLRVFDL